MSAELQSASLVSQIATPLVPDGYYRSKLFVSSSATNPLIAASAPILSLVERLSASASLPSIKTIRGNIQHELNAFVNRLQGLKYTEELIVIAHYLLSATIDELIAKNYMRVYATNVEFQAFTPLAPDEIGPDKRFFEILDEVKKRAIQYLDLVELAYYCLISGFEGEYHLCTNGRQNLDNLIEELYHLIQQHRVHKPEHLFKTNTIPVKKSNKLKTLIAISTIGIGLLIFSVYAGSTFINNKVNSLLNVHFISLDK